MSTHGAEERITNYMRDILKVVVRGNLDGTFVDLDQLLERLAHTRTKQSIQFTIRTMIKKGLIAKKGRETRRGRSRVILAASQMGYEQANAQFSAKESEEILSLFKDL